MISSVQIQNNNPYNDTARVITGVGAGLLTQKVVKSVLAEPANFAMTYKMVDMARSVSESDNLKIVEAVKSMLNATGLAEKVKTKIYTKEDLLSPKIQERYKNLFELEENLKKTRVGSISRDILVGSKSRFFSYLNGTNAAFNTRKNTVIVAENNVVALPHETGHAIFYNNSKWGRFFANSRYLTHKLRVLDCVMLSGLLARKHDKKDGKALTFTQKVENTLHDNLGLIAGWTSLPYFAEESGASLIAHKYTKKLLPKHLHKQVTHLNGLGYLTYILGAATTAVSASAAVKVKDKTVEFLTKRNSKSEKTVS